jgi:hypothetical protein
MKKIIIGILILVIAVGGYVIYQSEQKKNENIIEKTIQKSKEEVKQKLITHKIALVALDGSKLATDLKNKDLEKIGCDDVVIYKDVDGELTDKQVLEKMFVFNDYIERDGTYNVFSLSKNLKVESMEIDEVKTMVIKLTGELIVGGMWDVPRVSAQIVKTIESFNADIKNIEIYINNEELSDFLSEKDDMVSDKDINPIEKKIETKPVSSAKKQSFILTHNGVL